LAQLKILATALVSVADPDHFDTDPDPAFHFDKDPDPAFQSDTDPDPTV
jgi:hypothetical protein